MEKQNVTLLIVIALIVAGVYLVSNLSALTNLFSVIEIDVPFAGYNFHQKAELTDVRTLRDTTGLASATALVNEDDYYVMKATAGIHGRESLSPKGEVFSYTAENFRGVDEVIVFFDYDYRVSGGDCSNGRVNINFGLYNVGTGNKLKLFNKDASAGNCEANAKSKSDTSKVFAWKFVNNFDGTWDAKEYSGVGEIYITKGTVTINSDDYRFYVSTSASVSPGTITPNAEVNLKIYNIVTKVDEVAVCQADEIMLGDKSCVDSNTLFLEHEDAIIEMYSDRLDRVEGRLNDKISFLESENEALKQELLNKLGQGASDEELANIEAKLNAKIRELQLALESKDEALLKKILEDDEFSSDELTLIYNNSDSINRIDDKLGTLSELENVEDKIDLLNMRLDELDQKTVGEVVGVLNPEQKTLLTSTNIIIGLLGLVIVVLLINLGRRKQ